jgi:hypothetical protein
VKESQFFFRSLAEVPIAEAGLHLSVLCVP